MLDLSFSASFITKDNLGGLVDFLEEEVFADAMVEATEFILERTALTSDYGFTDRTQNLRKSIEVTDNTDTSRSEISVEVIASAINPKDGFDYARIIEFGYGGRFSYLRRAAEEGAAIFPTLLSNAVRDRMQQQAQDIRQLISQGRKKNVFFRDSRGRFAKLPTDGF